MESLFLRKKLCNGELTQSSTHVSIYIAILDSPNRHLHYHKYPYANKRKKKESKYPFQVLTGKWLVIL